MTMVAITSTCDCSGELEFCVFLPAWPALPGMAGLLVL